MNRQMWENKATQRNVAQLARDGVVILGPASGDQACGETGMGRMLEAQQIFDEINSFLQPKLLAGANVLITAGPTFEAIDPVRGITNRSSGKMGYAIARAAIDAGAKVTLVTGPVSLEAPAAARVERVESANDMFNAVKKHAKAADIFIGVAAVADYRVDTTSKQKIKRTDANLTIETGAQPGHSRVGRGAAEAAILRRFRRREPEAARVRGRQTAQKESAADGRQSRAGRDRRGR